MVEENFPRKRTHSIVVFLICLALVVGGCKASTRQVGLHCSRCHNRTDS